MIDYIATAEYNEPINNIKVLAFQNFIKKKKFKNITNYFHYLIFARIKSQNREYSLFFDKIE